MRIVIDLQACQSGSRLGGIGRYSMNLAQAMINQSAGHELIFVLSNLFPQTTPEIYQTLRQTISKNQIRIFNVPSPVDGATPSNAFRIKTAELLRENFIFSLKPDIVFICSLIEGLGDDVVTSVGSLLGAERTSVILYDLIPLVQKEMYLQDPITKNHYYEKLENMKKAGSLLAISEFSRLQGIELLQAHPDVVTTISSAIDEKFKPIEFTQAQISQVHAKHGIVRDFLLFTGSFDQRKNHERLIQSFARLPKELRNSYQLLIIGNGWEGIYKHLNKVAQNEGLGEDELIFAGHVSDSDLLTIYNTCTLFVFASLSEGFGLPALEAMSCAVPTIGSNTTSIPEVIGLSEALFDPYDVQSITAKITQALTDTSFRKRLKEHALQHSKTFSWNASAKKAIAALEILHEKTNASHTPLDVLHQMTIAKLSQILQVTKPNESDIVKIAAAMDANYRASSTIDLPRKIAWVTTWNSKCGIAMYSQYLGAAHASEYHILASYDDALVCPDDVNVTRCWRAEEDNLKQLAQTVDDLHITTLSIQFNYGLFDFQALSDFLYDMATQGRSVFITLHSTTDTATKKLAQLAPALRLCDKIIVHSKDDLENLRKANLLENALLFPQGIVDTQPSKKDLALSPDTYIIASYGFFLPHKGFLELIDAVKILRDQGVDIHLLMINAQYPADISKELIRQAKEKISSFGLQKNVTLVSDFLSDADSLGYLSQAHLVVYPYQETGESSSAAVRMGLASAQLVAVTPLKIFSDVSQAVVTFASTATQDIAEGIDALRLESYEKSDRIKTTLANAQQWRQTHLYSTLGEDFCKLITQKHS